MKTPTMKRLLSVAVALAVLGAAVAPAAAADDSKVKAATRQVDRGAHKIGDGKVGEGAADMAKGIGKTVFEGAKFAGENVKEFFTRLFSS